MTKSRRKQLLKEPENFTKGTRKTTRNTLENLLVNGQTFESRDREIQDSHFATCKEQVGVSVATKTFPEACMATANLALQRPVVADG